MIKHCLLLIFICIVSLSSIGQNTDSLQQITTKEVKDTLPPSAKIVQENIDTSIVKLDTIPKATTPGIRSNQDSLLNFIAKNRQKCSVYLMRSDSLLVHLNENKMMPLANTMNMLVAIEFAKQEAHDLLYQDDFLPLTDLEKYYIEGTDNNAYETWLEYANGKHLIKEDSVRLIDVARGMMMFNVNANAEYLIDLMGIDNVASNIRILKLDKHSGLSPMVSSMFLYQNPARKKESSILKAIEEMNDEDYCRQVMRMHKALENDPGFRDNFRLKEFNYKMQKLWSERLTASTTKYYTQIATILNRRLIFDDATYGFIAEIMETIMEKPGMSDSIKHSGVTGGATPFVLTRTFYTTFKNKFRIEMAYFFQDLTETENNKLRTWVSDFERAITYDGAFRTKVSTMLK